MNGGLIPKADAQEVQRAVDEPPDGALRPVFFPRIGLHASQGNQRERGVSTGDGLGHRQTQESSGRVWEEWRQNIERAEDGDQGQAPVGARFPTGDVQPVV